MRRRKRERVRVLNAMQMKCVCFLFDHRRTKHHELASKCLPLMMTMKDSCFPSILVPPTIKPFNSTANRRFLLLLRRPNSHTERSSSRDHPGVQCCRRWSVVQLSGRGRQDQRIEIQVPFWRNENCSCALRVLRVQPLRLARFLVRIRRQQSISSNTHERRVSVSNWPT